MIKKLVIPELEKNSSTEQRQKFSRYLVYGLTVLFSTLFIVIGHQIASQNLPQYGEHLPALYLAKVDAIISSSAKANELLFEDGSPQGAEQVTVTFQARFLQGDQKGNSVEARQNSVNQTAGAAPPDLVQSGDRVFITPRNHGQGAVWTFVSFERTRPLLILFALFSLLLLVFGRAKGLHTLLSLLFTCGATFFVLIPAVLSGQNIYAWTITISLFIVTMSLLMINGANKKTAAAGSSAILALAGGTLVMLKMSQLLRLSGLLSEESMLILRLNPSTTIDLKALVFCAILLGTTGAVMDVSMDIASSLHEMAQTREGKDMRVLLKSAFAIGKDTLGTMVNTLILAYVGGSLTPLLLLVALNQGRMTYMFNSEGLVFEVLQMLIGALSMLITVPLTALICSLIYTGQSKATRAAQR